MRRSQNGSHPHWPSRNAKRSRGNRSITPPMMTSMHASICSTECVEMWAMPSVLKRSAPAARMREPVVPRVVPRPVVEDVRAEEDRLHRELGDGAACLGDGTLDVVGRDHGSAEEPLRVRRLDEVVQPV